MLKTPLGLVFYRLFLRCVGMDALWALRHVVFNRFIENECVSCGQSPHHVTLGEYTITRPRKALNNQSSDAKD